MKQEKIEVERPTDKREAEWTVRRANDFKKAAFVSSSTLIYFLPTKPWGQRRA